MAELQSSPWAKTEEMDTKKQKIIKFVFIVVNQLNRQEKVPIIELNEQNHDQLVRLR